MVWKRIQRTDLHGDPVSLDFHRLAGILSIYLVTRQLNFFRGVAKTTVEARYNYLMNTVLREGVLPTSQTIQIVQGDITIEETDAIVNAANEYLQHGGGVAYSPGHDMIHNLSDHIVVTIGKIRVAVASDFQTHQATARRWDPN